MKKAPIKIIHFPYFFLSTIDQVLLFSQCLLHPFLHGITTIIRNNAKSFLH